MEPTRRIGHEELAPDAAAVLDAVRRGEPALVERNGEPEAAIVDIVDYRILRATARFQSEPPVIRNPEAGLEDAAVSDLPETQQRYDLVIGYYLAEAISLGRAAELLSLNSIDLRLRFHRLGVPLRFGPETVEEAWEDIRAAESVGRLPL